MLVIDDVKVGHRVRSYDFPMHLENDHEYEKSAEACFVEGIVEKITNTVPGEDGFERVLPYKVYVIRIEREVFNGIEKKRNRDYITAPINGQPQMFSDYPTHGVRVIK